MQHLLQILLLFIVVASLLKLSFWKLWQTVVFGFVCALFVVLSCRWAILQSKTQLADFLANTAIMQDAAVLITLETAFCFAFCFAELGEIYGRGKRKCVTLLLRWYPGLLLFPALFYLQTQLIFALPGIDFGLLSYAFAAVVFVALPLGARLIVPLLPEKELRLEVCFLVSLFVCLIGLISSANGKTTYAALREPFDVGAMLVSLALFAVFFAAGIILNKVKYKLKKQ